MTELAGFQLLDVLGFRPGERMMDRVPFVVLRAESHQREVDDPEEIERTGVGSQALHFGDAGADSAEHFANNFPFVGGEQNQIAFFHQQLRAERFLFPFAEKLHDRRFPLAIFHLDEGEPLGAVMFCHGR